MTSSIVTLALRLKYGSYIYAAQWQATRNEAVSTHVLAASGAEQATTNPTI
jgi:hypothetical protein